MIERREILALAASLHSLLFTLDMVSSSHGLEVFSR